MRISDWSSDVCSSELPCRRRGAARQIEAHHRAEAPLLRTSDRVPRMRGEPRIMNRADRRMRLQPRRDQPGVALLALHPREQRAQPAQRQPRSEEHTSELQSLMRISYAVFCLKKNTAQDQHLVHNTYSVD